jgi:uncharacterized protein (TIGR02001 family)
MRLRCARGCGRRAAMFRPCFCALAMLAAAPAIAQEEAAPATTGAQPALDPAFEINLLSDYRFRGISRSDEDPAVQAALTVFHDSGLYAGMRGTSLSGSDEWRRRDPAFQDLGDVQLDLYAGFRTDLGGGFDLDAGALYYLFAGGDGATDYVEPYASLSYLIGPVQLTGGAKYAPSQAAIGNEDMLYLFGQVDFTVPFRPWSVSAQLGRQDWGAYGSYWTWSLGAAHQLQIEGIPDTEIGLRYVDTDLSSGPGRDAGVILSVGLRF